MLRGLGLKKSWGQVNALVGINIEVQRGTITCVIGPSGAGKSTLLRSLSLVDPPDAGQVCVDGHSFNFPSRVPVKSASIWPDVTMVFQQLFLWPHLRLRDNILLPLRSSQMREMSNKILPELISRLEMEGFLDRYPNEASLGQKQRVAISRAIVLQPKYLLLDEVTSALDVDKIAIVASILRDLAKGGTGVLVVSHLLGFARQVADRLIFLDSGRKVAEGAPSILDSPTSNNLERFLRLFSARRMDDDEKYCDVQE